MELRETMRKNQGELRKLDLESFGEIMDEFIEQSAVGIAVSKEEGEKVWTIHGAGCGSVIDFYIYLNGMEPIFLAMLDEMERVGGIEAEKLVDSLLGELRKGLLEAAKEHEKEKKGARENGRSED